MCHTEYHSMPNSPLRFALGRSFAQYFLDSYVLSAVRLWRLNVARHKFGCVRAIGANGHRGAAIDGDQPCNQPSDLPFLGAENLLTYLEISLGPVSPLLHGPGRCATLGLATGLWDPGPGVSI